MSPSPSTPTLPEGTVVDLVAREGDDLTADEHSGPAGSAMGVLTTAAAALRQRRRFVTNPPARESVGPDHSCVTAGVVTDRRSVGLGTLREFDVSHSDYGWARDRSYEGH